MFISRSIRGNLNTLNFNGRNKNFPLLGIWFNPDNWADSSGWQLKEGPFLIKLQRFGTIINAPLTTKHLSWGPTPRAVFRNNASHSVISRHDCRSAWWKLPRLATCYAFFVVTSLLAVSLSIIRGLNHRLLHSSSSLHFTETLSSGVSHLGFLFSVCLNQNLFWLSEIRFWRCNVGFLKWSFCSWFGTKWVKCGSN